MRKLAAGRAWEETSTKREHGRGRRPTQRQVTQLAKRVALDTASYEQAVARLRSWSAHARPAARRSPKFVQRVHARGKEAGRSRRFPSSPFARPAPSPRTGIWWALYVGGDKFGAGARPRRLPGRRLRPRRGDVVMGLRPRPLDPAQVKAMAESFSTFCDGAWHSPLRLASASLRRRLRRDGGRFVHHLAGVSAPRGNGKSLGGASPGCGASASALRRRPS